MKKTSIRIRLMIMVIFIATLPVVFSTIVATNNIRNFSSRENIKANEARVRWGTSYLEELIAQLDKMFYSLQINEKLEDSITHLDNDSISVSYYSQSYATETLATAYYANSRKIEELIYYSSNNNKTFGVSYKILGDINYLDGLQAYWTRLESSQSNIYFEPFEEDIYAVHSLNRFKDQQMYGGLAVKIKDDVWKEILEILEPFGEEKVFVINDERRMIAGTGDINQLNIFFEALDDNSFDNMNETFNDVELIDFKGYYYFIQDVDGSKLQIIKSVPISQIRAGEINTIRASLVIMALTICVAMILSVIFSIRISKPIVQLARTMRSADLEDIEFSSRQSIDEIDLLENGYNQMVLKLKELIQEEYQHEIELKNAQLLALQAQINPHFLNNTLNLIGGMALEKDSPEIYDMTRSISDLLRYSIKDSDELVRLKEELNHVNNYLKIQQKRYEGRCAITFVTDETVNDIMVPKFILQPIIENAFEYGLQPKPGEWQLTIRIFKIGEKVVIAVKDNGIGMTRDKLNYLRDKLKYKNGSIIDIESKKYESPLKNSEKKEGTGIGLKNVALRLKLCFRKESSMRVFSKEHVGTMVILVIACDERRT